MSVQQTQQAAGDGAEAGAQADGMPVLLMPPAPAAACRFAESAHCHTSASLEVLCCEESLARCTVDTDLRRHYMIPCSCYQQEADGGNAAANGRRAGEQTAKPPRPSQLPHVASAPQLSKAQVCGRLTRK
jgi:hypothetical protein